MSELTWSSAKPEQEGWWWMRQRLNASDEWNAGQPVYVKRMKNGQLMQWDNGMAYPLEAFRASWAGPIPLPVEQPASKT